MIVNQRGGKEEKRGAAVPLQQNYKPLSEYLLQMWLGFHEHQTIQFLFGLDL